MMLKGCKATDSQKLIQNIVSNSMHVDPVKESYGPMNLYMIRFHMYDQDSGDL